jgi:hypothetical protein
MAVDSKARLCFFASLTVALCAPGSSRAAEVTRVATAAEIDNPFDLDLSVGFARTQRRATITREQLQNGEIVDVPELRYAEIINEMPMRLAFGIYQDLELHVGVSMVFSDDKLWRYPAIYKDGVLAVNDSNSSIQNNYIGPQGNLISGPEPLFAVPGKSYRAGLGNLSFGISWAALNDQKDDTKPKWVLSFDYSAPTATVDNPAEATSASGRGALGDKVHRFNFSTALSKRLGAIDPYVKLSYSLPTQGPNYWTNCNNPNGLGFSASCGQVPWTRSEIGIRPQHVGGFIAGAELLPLDDPSGHQQIAIDFQVGGFYNSSGRIYNELSDALGKQLYTEEYLTLGGSIGLYARAAEYVQLKLNASLYTDTSHFLTNESMGKDLDGSGRIELADPTSVELNPNFDPRYDVTGRRFRISEVNVFTIMATGTVSF